MPWVGREKYEQLVGAAIRNETRAMNAEAQVDILRADLERMREDFNELTRITAGRVPPKLSPEFTKDPFQEDRSLPEIYLTPDPDDIDLTVEQAQELMAQTDGAENPEGRDEYGPGESA